MIEDEHKLFLETDKLFFDLSYEFRGGMINTEFKKGWPDNFRDLFDDYMTYCAVSI